jgi:exopolysaccharide production protein ExoZ
VIRPIQYLRALAAMMVVWVHSVFVIPSIAERLGGYGGSGVNLFFVISGFVMVVTTTKNDMTPAEFFLRRLIRVAPLYWLATIAMIAIASIVPVMTGHSFTQMPYSASAIAKSLLFVPFTAIEGSPGSVWPIVQQGWTLNYEMFFYTLFALSLAAPARVRLPALSVTLVSLVVIGRVFGPFAHAVASTYSNSYLLEFVAGIILAQSWLRGGSRDSLPQSLFLIVFGFYCLGSLNSRLTVLGGAFLVVAGCLSPKICAIQNRPLMDLGNASYSIYLTHQFVLEALAWSWMRVFPLATWTSSVFFMSLALVLCALAGCLCYRFIERPLTSHLRRLLTGSDPIAKG